MKPLYLLLLCVATQSCGIQVLTSTELDHKSHVTTNDSCKIVLGIIAQQLKMLTTTCISGNSLGLGEKVQDDFARSKECWKEISKSDYHSVFGNLITEKNNILVFCLEGPCDSAKLGESRTLHLQFDKNNVWTNWWLVCRTSESNALNRTAPPSEHLPHPNNK